MQIRSGIIAIACVGAIVMLIAGCNKKDHKATAKSTKIEYRIINASNCITQMEYINGAGDTIITDTVTNGYPWSMVFMEDTKPFTAGMRVTVSNPYDSVVHTNLQILVEDSIVVNGIIHLGAHQPNGQYAVSEFLNYTVQ